MSLPLPTLAPEQIGLDPDRLDLVFRRLERWTDEGRIPAAAICLGRGRGIVGPRVFGRMGPGPDFAPAGLDALFLVASLTKPVVVTAAVMLVERGELGLDDRVAEHLPSFGRNGKEDVRLRHLMTHTSGLPDMLPNNDALCAAHAPLSRFVDEVAGLPLAFAPGTQVSYQSMGTAVLGEVVSRVSGLPLAEFLRGRIFEPLGMSDTSLGWRPESRDRIAAVRLDPASSVNDWNWNSPYWLGFGAPWGGLISSAADLARFCRMTLNGGVFGGVRLLSPAAVRSMTANQLAAMPGVPEVERRCRPWGLGWQLNWPAHSANFGDLLGPRSFGHWGATGTLCWLDPDADAFLVLLTTEPGGADGRLLSRLSNSAAAALV